MVCYSRPTVYAYVPNFISVYSVALCWRKTPVFAVFWTSTFSVLTKLNTGAQLQTFPYPTASKLFLYSYAFMAKWDAQSLTFKSVTNRQTNSHQTWHGDRGPRARSCTSKTFGLCGRVNQRIEINSESTSMV